jgi:hypothetical protein
MLDLESYIFSYFKSNVACASITYIEQSSSYYSSSF